MSTAASKPTVAAPTLQVAPLLHPQGCRTYLIADPHSNEALALDVHLDLVSDVTERVAQEGWTLKYIVDTHTHADHPSGAGPLAEQTSATRVAHERAGHEGVSLHPADGDALRLGMHSVTVRHAPGHTPDHLVLLTDGAFFSGDTLLIGGVARTDFLGGNAGQLFDSIHALIASVDDATRLYPGHDYKGRTSSTIGHERRHNPWLALKSRDEFVGALTAHPPPRPANMDALLRFNKKGIHFAGSLPADEAVRRVAKGGAHSVVDIRTGAEVAGERVPGAVHIPLEHIRDRADEIRAIPAPRLLLCHTGSRAEMAKRTLESMGMGGLIVLDGGIVAYRQAGGVTEQGKRVMSLERQVRIAAGTLVVIGCALGTFVHPWLYALAAFVGAGLVFAGLTDTCGMGLMLARMPWNQARGDAAGEKGPNRGGCAANLPAPVAGCAAGLPEGEAGGCSASPPPR